MKTENFNVIVCNTEQQKCLSANALTKINVYITPTITKLNAGFLQLDVKWFRFQNVCKTDGLLTF